VTKRLLIAIAITLTAINGNAQVIQTFAALGAYNIFTAGLNTFEGILATNITDSALTAGNCVQASTSGLLVTTSNPCGTGGGSVTSITCTAPVVCTPTPIVNTGVISLSGEYYTLEVNGTSLSAGDTVNFNTTTPASPSNGYNVTLATSKSGSTDSVSAAVVGDGNAAHALLGTGVFGVPYTLPTQYTKLRCETGLGDGLNAMTAGTYLESFCYNDSGVTWTITGVRCYVDGGSSSTLNAAGNTLGALLTGAIACSTSFASGTQSANVLLTSGDYIKFTFVADGTAKQTTWVVSMSQ
jgi:hypothetical protein